MKAPLEAYYEYMRQKGCAKRTLRGTESVLGLYATWVRMNYTKSILEVTSNEIEEYITHLRGRITQGTLSYKLGIIRVFYRYCLNENIILTNPIADIDTVPRGENLPRYVPSEVTVMELLHRAWAGGTKQIRDRAIMELMYSSALRLNEVILLNVRDIDTKEGIVYVRKGKGGSARLVPLGKEACKWIELYLERVRPRYAHSLPDEPLFLTERKNRIAARVIHNIYRRYTKGLDTAGKITSHTMRHACALHMLRCGASIETVQMILGHKSLESTQIYTRLYPKDLKIAHARYHPRG